MMKRWLSTLFIGLYLTAMSLGIASHAMGFGQTFHTGMYFFVWDMFCGWSSHELRYYVIGEGESGTYYELTPGPWKHFMPYGDLGREHYDVLGNAQRNMALNTLRQTDHEPMRRIVMIEEVWPKQYNMSDRSWAARFDEPKDPMAYYWQRSEMTEEGVVTSHVPEYLTYLRSKSVANNPRLIEDLHRGHDHYILSPYQRVAANNLGVAP